MSTTQNKKEIRRKFYNVFHQATKSQSKIISKRNFTYRLILNTVNKLAQNKINILDYGCGAGTIAFYLSNLGHSVVGYDVSDKAIVDAKIGSHKLKLKNVVFTNNENTAFSKKYDLIICTEVIEHVEFDLKLLKKLAALLKSEGILFISTPSINAPLYRLGATHDFDKRVGHLRRYEPELLLKLVQKSGLKVQSVTKVEGIIRNSLFVIPILGHLVRFIKGPVSDFVTFLDDISVKLFGESDIFIIAKKI